MYDLEIDCVQKRKAELLKLYPFAGQRIISSITDYKKFPDIKPEKAKALLSSDKLLAKYAKKVSNITYD